ncbi:MAG: bifunctional folylpolyglutamate synthase/dihydrofolate synthase [Isosphaeraceae bacterium]
MTSDYQERLDYLHNRLNYEWQGMPRGPADLTLGRMRRLLKRLGDPQAGLPIIHIAGTKGKGSTAAMVAAALTSSGLRTGLYCSPHLHQLEERFTIDGQPAFGAELVGLVDDVREADERLELEDALRGERHSTFFELTTAMGLLHFARRGVEAVVLEVGMGGRLDSTNVVHPVLSIITSISFDHTRQLGNTLGLIATEKAGILKRGRPAVSGVDGGEAQQSIHTVASRRRCRLRELGTDFGFKLIPPELPLVRPTACRVAVRTWRTDWGCFTLPLLGPHQGHNAAVALAGLDVLAEERPDLAVSRNDVVRGFAGLKWPARVEILGQRPCLVIDGAHNAASAIALSETLRTCFPQTRRTLVFGTTREKDLQGQLLALLPLFDEVIATRYLENPRAMPTETIAAAGLMLTGQTIRTTEDPAEALELARRLTAPDELICVTGSLFLAAEVRAIILRHQATRIVGGVVL